ncbi:hypothetical protein Emag_004916 [Eimeria magna]
MATPQESVQASLSQPQQTQQEVCCWRFEPVVVLGREGTVVLTAKRLLFASRRRNNGGSSGGGEDSSNTWEVLLQFPLAAWTSTERSKKAAKLLLLFLVRRLPLCCFTWCCCCKFGVRKVALPFAAAHLICCVHQARMSYVSRAGGAAGGPEKGPGVQSVVVDFVGMREKMELCCRSLQTLASAARTIQSKSSFLQRWLRPRWLRCFRAALLPLRMFLCPLDVPLLLHLLQLPADTPLRIAPALLEQQELQEREFQQQLAEEQQQAKAFPPGAGGAPLEAAAPPEAVPAAEGKHQQQEKQQHGLGELAHKSARQKVTAAKAQSVNAAAAAAKAAGSAAAAAAAAATAAPRIELPSWEALQKQQQQQEADQLKQLQQKLLQENPELLAVYKAVVEPPEGQSSEGRDQQKGLSPEEFWRLHQHQLQALRPQPTPEAVSAAFLSRPPQYHLEGQQGGDALGSGELVVDCSEQMLSQILKEDPTIRAAHSSLVETGRLSADRFWGRVFRSKYFQSGIGLAERHQEVNEEEASAFVESYLKEAVKVQLLQPILWQVRGFGLPDGLSSLAGDLAEKGPYAGSTGSAATAAASSSLVGRFNRHSQRLLLQQLLQPAAAAAAAHDDAATRDKVELVLRQERHLRNQAAAAAAAAGVPPADPNDAATRETDRFKGPVDHAVPAVIVLRKAVASAADGMILCGVAAVGCGVMAEEAPLLAALRLAELDEVSSTKYQTLGVSRRQLYAAGARGPRSPAVGAAAAASDAASAVAKASFAEAAAGGRGAADATDRLASTQEAEAAKAWLRLQKSRAKARNSGALQSAEEVAAVYETGRYMFVFNTKLCQKDKAAQVATLDYELSTVNAVRARQARVGELLRHFYSTTLPEEKKRTRLVQALDAIKAELENSQDFGGGFTGAATKALSAPLVEQITAARRHANRLQRLLQAAREKRATQQSRHAMQQQQIASAGS